MNCVLKTSLSQIELGSSMVLCCLQIRNVAVDNCMMNIGRAKKAIEVQLGTSLPYEPLTKGEFGPCKSVYGYKPLIDTDLEQDWA